jgi:DNA-directed RNA polymerase subunit E'/Rpb7
MDGGASKTKTIKKDTKKEIRKTSVTNNDLFKNILLTEDIYLKPMDLNCKIDDIILAKLKKKVEGRCLKVGFIVRDSVKIQSRSLGMINNASFDGMTSYKVTYTADVCNPAVGQLVQCQVGNIDKSQIICYIDEPHDMSAIEIYLFKHHHVGNEEFDELQKGDIINVKIVGSKWEYRDTQISSIAQYVGKAV